MIYKGRFVALYLTMSIAVFAQTHSRPTITIDEAHHQVERSYGEEAPPYHIPASDSVMVDATDYEFGGVEGDAIAPPNMVQLVNSKGIYRADWDAQNKRAILNSTTLKVLRGDGPFPGFRAGESYILAIGNAGAVQAVGSAPFRVRWVGIIAVTASAP